VGEPGREPGRCPFDKIVGKNKRLDAGMQRFVQSIFNGAFALLRGPLFVSILIAIVISVIRQQPRQLAPVRPRERGLLRR
jgi:hypothetical protein